MTQVNNSNPGNEPAQSGAAQESIALSQLSNAEMQALVEKVMALLKRDLQLERERLHGR